jgi:hypothetical protein
MAMFRDGDEQRYAGAEFVHRRGLEARKGETVAVYCFLLDSLIAWAVLICAAQAFRAGPRDYLLFI